MSAIALSWCLQMDGGVELLPPIRHRYPVPRRQSRARAGQRIEQHFVYNGNIANLLDRRGVGLTVYADRERSYQRVAKKRTTATTTRAPARRVVRAMFASLKIVYPAT